MEACAVSSSSSDCNMLALLQEVLSTNRNLVAKVDALQQQVQAQAEVLERQQKEWMHLSEAVRSVVSSPTSQSETAERPACDHKDPLPLHHHHRPVSPAALVPLCDSSLLMDTASNWRRRRESTLGLAWVAHFSSMASPPAPQELEGLLDSQADIYYYHRGYMRHPIFHTFVAKGCVDAVETIIRRGEIDYSVTDEDGCTPLHLVCRVCPAPAAPLMLRVLIRQIEDSLSSWGEVDWRRENNEKLDFINCAAACGRLALLADEIKRSSFFSSLPPGAILLKVPVTNEDWNRLSAEDQHCFVTQERKATEDLVELMEACGNKPEVDAVQRCVEKGADVTWQIPGGTVRVLSKFISDGYVDAVAACLKSPQSIDFTLADANGWTPLHWIVPGRKTKEQVMALLELVVDRVEQRTRGGGAAAPFTPHSAAIAFSAVSVPPMLQALPFLGAGGHHSPAPATLYAPVMYVDIIDWGQKDRSGHECISMAAAYGFLAAWWGIVKARQVPYYVAHVGPIEVTRPVRTADWNLLSEEDRKKFQLDGGLR